MRDPELSVREAQEISYDNPYDILRLSEYEIRQYYREKY